MTSHPPPPHPHPNPTLHPNPAPPEPPPGPPPHPHPNSTKETEEQIWASIELGRSSDGATTAAPTAVGGAAAHGRTDESNALLGRADGDDSDELGDEEAAEEEVIQMEPVAESARFETRPEGEAAQRLRGLSVNGSPSPPPPPVAAPARARSRQRQRIFYRVSKRTSTVAFLERIFEDELDEHVPARRAGNHAGGAAGSGQPGDGAAQAEQAAQATRATQPVVDVAQV